MQLFDIKDDNITLFVANTNQYLFLKLTVICLRNMLHRMRQLLLILFMGNTILLGAQNNSQYVNVFIGTDGTGHTFPGPSMPFGMVQPGPDNNDHDWNYTSGYQYRDSVLLGFSQTRFSGTGINEMGDVLLLPISETRDKSLPNRYFKNTEMASVGYYSVTKRDGVGVELTASERVAFHRYSFPSKQAKVFVDFQHKLRFISDSVILESDVNIDDSQTISGYCRSKNWVDRKYFFVIKFDKPFSAPVLLPRERSENAPKYYLSFNLGKDQVLQVKVALSTVDVTGAKLNLQTEVPGWDFNRVRENAKIVWDKYLNRIDIEANAKQREIFYTSLYHLLLQPSNIADVDGRYRGADDKVANTIGNEYYSTLSVWDIYRGAFPLIEIVAPEKVNGIIRSMLLHHRAAGFLPIWTAWGQDSYCMIGNHSIPMILSAYNNGFDGFDPAEALKVMVEASTQSHINSDWELYNRYGYYPFDTIDNESVSRTLESGYDDWCVKEMAKRLGDTSILEQFDKRANYFKNLFDNESRLFRGKDTQGQWRKPFDPIAATSPMNNPGDYTEANAWQYFWTPAQYSIDGIKKLLGGEDAFTNQLNRFFSIEVPNTNKFLGQEAMIGQYAHGNEPSHHVIYLYAYSNTPKAGHRLVREVINKFYSNTPNGMIGNDDCGQMSAWYILSSMGFYPVNPASNEYVLGAPQLTKVTLHLAGRTFTIEALDISDENIFGARVFLNGTLLKVPYISYSQIMAGGLLQFEMTNK